MDIKKVLESRKEAIDKTIEQYIPREYDLASLKYICGPTEYEHDANALNQAVAKPVWDLLDRGGKRWRPTLFMLVLEALGADPEKFQKFVVVPEVIHEGTLLVDDIEDGSEIRRGKPAIHKLFGEDIAINAGNAMYFLPLTPIMHSSLPPETKNKAYEIYIQEMINISFGQAYDIYWHKTDTLPTLNQYLQMCAFKTGTLARMSAKLGALFADSDKINEIGKLAETIGIAFQIQDDILNLKPGKDWGKDGGEDITEGKKTLLVIYTVENASPEDKRRLLEILSMHTKDPKLIKEAISIIEKYGSFEKASQFAKKIITQAWDDTKNIFQQGEAKGSIEGLVRYLIEREI